MNKKKRRLKNVFRVLPGVKTVPPKGPPHFHPRTRRRFFGRLFIPKKLRIAAKRKKIR
jgi:hypothetical protein